MIFALKEMLMKQPDVSKSCRRKSNKYLVVKTINRDVSICEPTRKIRPWDANTLDIDDINYVGTIGYAENVTHGSAPQVLSEKFDNMITGTGHNKSPPSIKVPLIMGGTLKFKKTMTLSNI